MSCVYITRFINKSTEQNIEREASCFSKKVVLKSTEKMDNEIIHRGFVWGVSVRGSNMNLSGLALAGLLGEKDGVDVGEDTTLSDGHVAEELVELFVVSDSELQVSGHDSLLAVVSGSVAGQLEDLSAQVLEHSGQVHGGATSDSVGESAKSQVSAASTNGEGETSSGTSGLGLALATSASFSFSFSRHVECV